MINDGAVMRYVPSAVYAMFLYMVNPLQATKIQGNIFLKALS